MGRCGAPRPPSEERAGGRAAAGRGPPELRCARGGGDGDASRGDGRLTPMQRFRQLEPSVLRSGQTTSLLASVREKDEVRELLGGILTPPCAGDEGRGTLAIARDKVAVEG